MRMRRTAFIMALMTVFTVSLFAQNSRGRNYIKQNISEWGGCRKVCERYTLRKFETYFTTLRVARLPSE